MNQAIKRLKEISRHLKNYNDILCLLGLGSMKEVERADKYSDMDFFLIVEDGKKDVFINDLSWLEVKPLSYKFKNTNDGYKVLFDDGVFGEFAVFEKHEMKNARFSKGLSYYHKDDFDLRLIEPRFEPKAKVIHKDFNIQEALTNLYIGLLRDFRGEKSSAMTFIQGHAYNLIIELFPLVFDEASVEVDGYVYERRIEVRFPDANKFLSTFRQGYQKNKESAKAMLDFLIKYFEVDNKLVDEIHKLLMI